MIRFIEGQTTEVKVSVASSIDTGGFTVSILIGGSEKSIASIEDGKSYLIDFDSSDIEGIPYEPSLGVVTVLDANGDLYQKMMVDVKKDKADGNLPGAMSNILPIVLAANWVGAGSGGGGGDSPDLSNYVKRSDFKGIDAPDNSINENNQAIRDMLDAAKGN